MAAPWPRRGVPSHSGRPTRPALRAALRGALSLFTAGETGDALGPEIPNSRLLGFPPRVRIRGCSAAVLATVLFY